MSVTKKTYTAAEKAKIALEAIKGELSVAQISSQYGVHVTQIKEWKAQALKANNCSLFSCLGNKA